MEVNKAKVKEILPIFFKFPMMDLLPPADAPMQNKRKITPICCMLPLMLFCLSLRLKI